MRALATCALVCLVLACTGESREGEVVPPPVVSMPAAAVMDTRPPMMAPVNDPAVPLVEPVQRPAPTALGPASVDALPAGDSALDRVVTYTSLGSGGEQLTWTLWVPGGIDVLRGVVKGGASVHYSEFARLVNFASLKAPDRELSQLPAEERVAMLLDALRHFAEELGHPELADAPLVGAGHSFSSGLLSSIVELTPERWIAVAPGGLEVAPKSEAVRSIPFMVWYGSADGVQSTKHVDNLLEQRPLGALFGIAPMWGLGHEWSWASNLIMAWWWQAIALRYPPTMSPENGAVQLLDIDEAAGWLGAMNGWLVEPDGRYKNVEPGTLPQVGRIDEPGMDPSASSWLIDAYTAAVWRAFSSPDDTVELLEPNRQDSGDKAPVTLIEPGATLDVQVQIRDRAAAAEKLELLDGDLRLAELTSAPWSFSGVSLPAGVHALLAIATFADGSRLSSRPSTVYSIRVACPTDGGSFPIRCIKAE